MNKSIYIFFLLIGLIKTVEIKGQFNQYTWKRELESGINGWNKIEISPEILTRLQGHIQAIRIYGVTEKDTIEMPYILKICREENIRDTLSFSLINKVRNGKSIYATFQLPETGNCDEINLDFKENNFDCYLKLEGSQNQKEWFMIGDSFRVVSVYNLTENYKYSQLEFSPVAYKYLRVNYSDDCNISLDGAYLFLNRTSACINDYYKFSQRIFEDKVAQQTIIELELDETNPVSVIKMIADDNFDFYRPINIEVLTDSFASPQGWHFTYSKVYDGTISSLEKNRFLFESIISKKIRITVFNGSNIPLHFGRIDVKGSNYELITRLGEAEKYVMVYGNENADFPHYDIEKFMDRIPADPQLVKTGNESRINDIEKSDGFTFFKSPVWLYGLIGIIVLVVGIFTIKMLKTENKNIS